MSFWRKVEHKVFITVSFQLSVVAKKRFIFSNLLNLNSTLFSQWWSNANNLLAS